MQKIKLNQKKTVPLKPNPFVRNFIPNAGQPFSSPNLTGEPKNLEISFEEFEIKSFTDIPALKIVLANLVETVFPLVLWRGEEYDKVGQWTDEQAVTKASELLNSASEEDIQKLYERRSPTEIAFEYNEAKSLSEKIGKEEFRKLISFIPMPNRPILPKQN
jgi:hypothetical protein